MPVAVDALTVYDSLPITTAMPEPEEIVRLGYRCMAHVSVGEEYSLGQFLQDLGVELDPLDERGQRPLFVGGTALWVRAVVNGFTPPRGALGLRRWLEVRLQEADDDRSTHHLLAQVDPAAAMMIDPRNRRRLIRALEVALASGGSETVVGDRLGVDCPGLYPQIGLALPPEVLARRISTRIEAQIARGWADEVARVLAMEPSRTARAAIGVAELGDYLTGKSSLDEAIELITRRTRRLVKRQLSWLRRDPRILWVSSIDEGLHLADRLLDEMINPVQRASAKSLTPMTSPATIRNDTVLSTTTTAATMHKDCFDDRGSGATRGSGAHESSASEGEASPRTSHSQTFERREDKLQLVKYSGAGNDFLVGEAPRQLPDTELIAALLNRTHGVGADGLILVELTDAQRPRMHLYNQDGSRAEMSGNGLRCLGHYLVERRGLGPTLSILTDAGVRQYRLVEQSNWAWLGETTMGTVSMTVEPDGSFLVDVGNPHRVIVMDGLVALEGLDIAAEGAKHQGLALETDGINVEWIVRSEDGCVMRVFERGVGPTMACGTGSVAAAWVARHLGWIRERAVVENPGGELTIHFGTSPPTSVGVGAADQGDPEVWLRGPSLLIADITPARWLFSL